MKAGSPAKLKKTSSRASNRVLCLNGEIYFVIDIGVRAFYASIVFRACMLLVMKHQHTSAKNTEISL